MSSYCPEKGDIVWLYFYPQTEYEQKGRRPAIVMLPKIYNSKTALALFCPKTNQIKGYPFKVKLPSNFPISGVIISDQTVNLGWEIRNAEFIAIVPKNVLNETVKEVITLVK